ncbi:MAG: hypothetical protein HYV19_02560 [Gemmatimonadetes bacterium]|nr:hypothetical protein [Gemmatimonadota bacterium]
MTVSVPSPAAPSYRHAHWYFALALAAIVAGFWPSFFRPLGAGDFAHSLHGVTATLWVVALIVQSALMRRGLVVWHRRVAAVALVVLALLIPSALTMVAVMFANPAMPPFLPPLLAFIDLPSLVFMIVLVTLALRNVRTPAAHKRFMASTVLLGFPPALTRLYARVFAPSLDFMQALHASFVTVEVILVALIVADWRAGERRLAYPLSLSFFGTIHSLMTPISTSPAWGAAMQWYTELPVFR